MRPSLARGDSVSSGKFGRNLQRKELQQRYPKDAQNPPMFGWKIRLDKWRWKHGLSVNQWPCARTAECCIRLNLNADKYEHVAVFELANLARAIEWELVAVYAPCTEAADEHENPCHFDMAPAEGRLEDLKITLKKFLADVFPGKTPSGAQEIEQALAGRAEFEQVFRVYRDVPA